MLISVKNIEHSLQVNLPLSKSESNRLLMISHYAGIDDLKSLTPFLSTSDDTVLLQNLLSIISGNTSENEVVELNCNNAGTVFRFLMTAVVNEQYTDDYRQLKYLLTGSDRMKERPIASLVDALRNLGVSIEYKGRDGYPPVMIKTCRIEGGRVEVSVEQSSQFASSLLLASPLWKKGLELHLTGNMSSMPYIDMTINMMRQYGIEVYRNGRDVVVKSGCYDLKNISVEPDWSAAAFWYEIAAFSETSDIMLKNLNIYSLQADAVSMKMFDVLGVKTVACNNGLVLKKKDISINNLTFDFKDCPDLFPAVIATCAGLGLDATFTGLENLMIKESDRKKAMINELTKVNISFEEVANDVLKMKCPKVLPFFSEEDPLVFDNYEDHRIAMALSVLSMKIGTISMEKTDVVSKSYPEFYKSIGL